jgi:hypothetical protein
MPSTHAAIALTLSLLAAAWIPMSAVAGSVLASVACALAAVTFFYVGRRTTNASVAEFGYPSSLRRVLLRVALFAIIIPNLLTALLYSTVLADGSSGEMGWAMRALFLVVLLPVSVVLAAYHGVPTILGGALLQILETNAPLPMWAWLVTLSAAFYAFLGGLFVLIAHAGTHRAAQKHRWR